MCSLTAVFSILLKDVLRQWLRFKLHKIAPLHIQGVPGGKDLTSGECSLGQTVPI